MSDRKVVLEYEAYKKIKKKKDCYGYLRKTLIHVHTPSSYDYRLLKNWEDKDYKKCSVDKLKEILIKIIDDKNITMSMLDFRKIFKKYKEIFINEKELISFIIMAAKIINNGVELVVVTDHNTIVGCEKLEVAIDIYKSNYNTSKIYPHVIYGIEISCADKLHVVGIFNKNKISNIQNYLNEIILSEKDGTYKTSLSVLKKFNKDFNEFAYIAHANTADLFKDTHMASGYRKQLYNSGYLNYIGVSKEEHKDGTSFRVKDRSYKDKAYIILDNDSHCIEDLDSKYMWLNGEKLGLDLFREAMVDYDVSVFFHEEAIQHTKYIEGIYIKNIADSNLPYLTGNNDEFIMKFSPSLNCLIGGRGTGKSTVLQLIEYVFRQRCDNERKLEFICNHGAVFILYYLEGKEYVLAMNMPYKEKDKHIYQYFGKNIENKYRYKYKYDESIKTFAFINNLEIYEVTNTTVPVLNKCKNKSKLLNEMFNITYSVNDLVNTASDKKINDFIFSTMFNNKSIRTYSNMIKKVKYSDLENITKIIETYRIKRQEKINNEINPFNEHQKGLLRIIHKLTDYYEEPNLYKWLFGNNNRNKSFFNYRISNEELCEYLLRVYDQEGLNNLLQFLYKRNLDTTKYSLINYAKDSKFSKDLDKKNIDFMGEKDILNKIYKMFENINLELIKNYLINFLKNNEEFTLEFNIDSKNGSKISNENYRDVKDLSLGQKVVAMLDFILGYSDYSNDYTPLIIDQPEDNLDNQYIYKNLVKQIRDTKSKRQIIIATHNAALVTNTMSEFVCVMESNGNHGWIKDEGHPGTKKIKKNIINYMEGGTDSFNHKIKIYKNVL